jgi:type IV pilus assembly protein PilA
MSIRPQRQRTRQGGFTLIELLVVVLIIGVLASIAIPAFLGQRQKAQDVAAKSIIRSGVIAAESYYAERETFAGMIPVLLADQEQNVSWTVGTANAKSNEVQVAILGPPSNEDSYILSSRSVTGTVFSYTRDPNGLSYKCSGTASATATAGCVAPYAGGW